MGLSVCLITHRMRRVRSQRTQIPATLHSYILQISSSLIRNWRKIVKLSGWTEITLRIIQSRKDWNAISGKILLSSRISEDKNDQQNIKEVYDVHLLLRFVSFSFFVISVIIYVLQFPFSTFSASLKYRTMCNRLRRKNIPEAWF